MDTGHAFLRHPPIRWTVGVSPGEGPGEGTPSPSTKTILALPPGSRPGSGHVVVIAREGRKPGEVTQNTTSHRHLSIHHSSISPPLVHQNPPQDPLHANRSIRTTHTTSEAEALPRPAKIGDVRRGSRSGRPGTHEIRLHEDTNNQNISSTIY